MENIIAEKVCTRCGEKKSLNEFSKHTYSKSGLRPECKSCNKIDYRNNLEEKKAYSKKYREEHREGLLEYFKRYRAENKQKYVERNLRQYGITQHEYNEILAYQDGKCAICKTEKPKGHSNKLYVDHDHKTGKVRGLLCSRCNSILGYCEDKEVVLMNAIAYLRKSNG